MVVYHFPLLTLLFRYYLANTEEDPGVQHFYALSTTTGDSTCISCDVKTSLNNEECLYNSAKFSSDLSYYVFNCAGPGFPEISLFSSDNKKLMVWEDNKELIETLGTNSLPETERFVLDIADDFKAQVLLKLPPNLDRSGNTKYPMVVNV